MKKIQRFLAMILSIVMIFSLTVFDGALTTDVKADTSFAITSPTAGSLQAAGYIDIKWTDASAQGTVKDYKVYVDGKLAATTKNTSCEYYTTKVNYHKVFVTATFTNGNYMSTDTVRFGVSKKGLALAADMGRNITPEELNISWYYNWGDTREWKINNQVVSHEQYNSIEFVPMVWSSSSLSNVETRTNNAVKAGYKYILAFNEPDLSGQAEMSVDTAFNIWGGFMNKNIRVGSPASYLWPDSSTWMKNFMNKINADSSKDVDFITIHCYPDKWNGGKGMADWFLETVVDTAWEMYHKPIWITEFSTDDDNQYISEAGTKSFIENVLPGLDERDYVERYAFFSFNRAKTNAGLWYYGTGALSSSGEAYAKLGNPVTDYVAGTISNPGTKNPNSTLNKPDKAKIKSAKNLKGRKIKVSIKKIQGAAGYQIRWSDSKKFNGYWKKNTKKIKYTLKKLDRKTTYYIKVRAYVKSGSSKLYGTWCKVRKVKVKK